MFRVQLAQNKFCYSANSRFKETRAAQRDYQRAIDLDTEGFFRQRAEKALEEL